MDKIQILGPVVTDPKVNKNLAKNYEKKKMANLKAKLKQEQIQQKI